MFSLTRPLEDTVIIRGEEIEVDFSFDTVLLWYELLDDKEVSSNEKIDLAFHNFIEAEFDPPLSLEEKADVVHALSEHMKVNPYGNNDLTNAGVEQETEDHSEPKYFSYAQDAGAIYASFLSDYGIDLDLERGKLHFDKFKALLAGLSEKSYFKRILSIRQTSIVGKEGETLSSLLEAQEYYALDSERSVNALDNQMGDIFSMLKTQAETG